MKKDIYNQIKNLVIDTETTIKVKDYTKNRVMLENYYEIGKLIVEAQGGEERAKYGDSLIKEFSKRLMIEVDKKYSVTLLKYVRQFYMMIEKGHALRDQLNWTCYRELLSVKNDYAIEYYVNLAIKNNLTYRQLHSRIKSKEYERLPESTKERLKENKELELKETITDPIIIPNPNNIKIIREKELQKLIMENIGTFLERLGTGYYYVGNEYKIKIGNDFHRIDLLLFNIEYESYVVIELKIGEVKKQDIGQIETYMNYIDKNLKKITHNKTIGIILCHKNNKLLMEYCSNPDIITREYVLN